MQNMGPWEEAVRRAYLYDGLLALDAGLDGVLLDVDDQVLALEVSGYRYRDVYICDSLRPLVRERGLLLGLLRARRRLFGRGAVFARGSWLAAGWSQERLGPPNTGTGEVSDQEDKHTFISHLGEARGISKESERPECVGCRRRVTMVGSFCS